MVQSLRAATIAQGQIGEKIGGWAGGIASGASAAGALWGWAPV
jgi:hypothetical protein